MTRQRVVKAGLKSAIGTRQSAQEAIPLRCTKVSQQSDVMGQSRPNEAIDFESALTSTRTYRCAANRCGGRQQRKSRTSTKIIAECDWLHNSQKKRGTFCGCRHRPGNSVPTKAISLLRSA